MTATDGGPMPPTLLFEHGLRSLADADALREHLDALNESGLTPVVVGTDSCPRPFLIILIGPYAESEDVLFDSPWQTDCEYGERVDGVWMPKPRRCDDCMAVSHGIEDLQFPLVVLVRTADLLKTEDKNA